MQLDLYRCRSGCGFSDGWREQRFSLFSSNEFEPSGETLVSVRWDRLNVLEPPTSQALK